jgi:hypothetical protein
VQKGTGSGESVVRELRLGAREGLKEERRGEEKSHDQWEKRVSSISPERRLGGRCQLERKREEKGPALKRDRGTQTNDDYSA